MKAKHKKRIAYILHNEYANSGRVYKHAHALANAGHEVTLFATWRNGLPLEEQEGDVKIVRIRFPILAALHVPLYKVRLRMPCYTIEVLLRLRHYSPDIVYCMNFGTLHIGYLSRKLYGAPYIYESEELFIGQEYVTNCRPITKRFYMANEYFLASRSLRVIQSSSLRAAQFKEWYGIDAEVIRNCAFLPKSTAIPLPPKYMELLKTRKKKIVYVGSITPLKGIEKMMVATSEFPNVQAFALGTLDGERGEKLLEQYADSLIWIPAVHPSTVTDVLQHFDLGVSMLPNVCLSYYLECPTKVWEIMSAGLPQIASDFPEIRRLLRENQIGPVGRVTDPENINDIEKNIMELLNDPDELDRYKKNCFELRKITSWDVESEKLVSLFDNLHV